MKDIIIVESPHKSKTIESYLGDNFKVLSSVGHIRDLATSGTDGLGIDIPGGFIPNYTIIKGKEKIVSELKKECKGHKVYLATDPDREGEAISYHLAEVLGLDVNDCNRVLFHEITKPAVLEAFKTPRTIDMALVESQETRRMLDRILGFKLSKLLQSKIKSQSAGRVQSVALKLIVDLEKEILAFVSTPYYELEALFDGFKASFYSYKENIKKIESNDLAIEIKSSLSKSFIVKNVEVKTQKRESKPPFTTSTMQQDASNKLNFTSSRTMRVAQSLFEGKKIGDQEVGLITYHRTDSTHLSDLFIRDAKEYIKVNYGDKYVGFAKEKKQALAQQAHEAIRPTSITRTPSMVKRYLTEEEYKLYKLIFERALTSLMSGAIFDRKKITLENNETVWTAHGQTMTFDGYTKVYGKEDDDSNKYLPNLDINDSIDSLDVVINELFTKPKSRYTEASLIKDMEELGIGRPSTYASTITTLKDRKYVDVLEKKLVPTEQGILTTTKLDEFFSPIINVKYTAEMESKLDQISHGELDEKSSLQEFYDDFVPLLDNAKTNMEAIYPKPTGEICPECGHELVIRKGKYGEFISCSNYPSCKYIKEDENKDPSDGIDTNIICPKCNTGHIVKRLAKRGKSQGSYFYACNNFPKCKNIYSDEPINELCPKCQSIMLIDKDGNKYCSNKCEEQGNYEQVKCPKCNEGYLVKKTALKGKNKGNSFYACSRFPKCKNLFSDEPTNEKCEVCGSMMLKNKDDVLYCSNETCEKASK